MLYNAYQSVYDLISNAIFAGSPEVAAYGVFMCEAVSTVACVILLAMPFVLIWRIIKRFI